MNILAEKVTKNHLKLMNFQSKPNATNDTYVSIYNTSWLEIGNHYYIKKTSVLAMLCKVGGISEI